MAAYKAQQASGVVSAGIVFARRAGYPYVVAPLPGSPAQKAGVQPGDLLDSVDGKTLRNAPFWQVQAALDGPEGSSCEIGLFRGGDEKKLTISVQRAKFEPPAPSTKWERDVAIIKIPSFSAAAAAAVRKDLEEAQRRQIGKVIVDLRDAIGGDVADAVPMAALFVGKGTIATVVARKVATRPLETQTDPVWKGKTVVLIDDSTGGPAEIFAAALHDRANAPTVGETTVGMAIIQKSVPTAEGGSLYMTVGRYVSPAGHGAGRQGPRPRRARGGLPGRALPRATASWTAASSSSAARRPPARRPERAISRQ